MLLLFGGAAGAIAMRRKRRKPLQDKDGMPG
ncbi:hypothetical protein [Erythrobacter westpacificensis]